MHDDASRYLLAQACMRLGKIPEAETALNPDNMCCRVCHTEDLCFTLLPGTGQEWNGPAHDNASCMRLKKQQRGVYSQEPAQISNREVLSIAAGRCSVSVTACVMCALKVQVPNGAAGYYLLGKICKMTKRPEKAIEHFATALRLDVLLWSAYEELCSLGRVSTVSPLYGCLVRPLRDAESMGLHGMPAMCL